MFEVDSYCALVPFAIVPAHCCAPTLRHATYWRRRQWKPWKKTIYLVEKIPHVTFVILLNSRWFFFLLFCYQFCCKAQKTQSNLMCCTPHTCLTFCCNWRSSCWLSVKPLPGYWGKKQEKLNAHTHTHTQANTKAMLAVSGTNRKDAAQLRIARQMRSPRNYLSRQLTFHLAQRAFIDQCLV